MLRSRVQWISHGVDGKRSLFTAGCSYAPQEVFNNGHKGSGGDDRLGRQDRNTEGQTALEPERDQ